MIEFRLDPRSGVPTYLQLVQQVKQALRLGILQPGDQLPTVKEVVGSLAINPNTVLKAYRELDREGVTEGSARTGDLRLARPAGRRAARLLRTAFSAAQVDRTRSRRRPGRREHQRTRPCNAQRGFFEEAA